MDKAHHIWRQTISRCRLSKCLYVCSNHATHHNLSDNVCKTTSWHYKVHHCILHTGSYQQHYMSCSHQWRIVYHTYDLTSRVYIRKYTYHCFESMSDRCPLINIRYCILYICHFLESNLCDIHYISLLKSFFLNTHCILECTCYMYVRTFFQSSLIDIGNNHHCAYSSFHNICQCIVLRKGRHIYHQDTRCMFRFHSKHYFYM